MTDALSQAREALLDTPSREESEIQSQFPRVNRYMRAEHQAFIDGALFANNFLLDTWRMLEFDHESNRVIEAVKAMLVEAINAVGDGAKPEADLRFPPFDQPTAKDLSLGKASLGGMK